MNLCSPPGEECSWNQGVEIKPTNLHITFDQYMCHSLKSFFVDKYISFQEICRQCRQASETLINHQYSELAKLTCTFQALSLLSENDNFAPLKMLSILLNILFYPIS